MRVHRHPLDGALRVVERFIEERGRDLHRERRSHQSQMGHASGCLLGRLQGSERTEAVAHQSGLSHPGGIEQGQHKVCCFFHTARGRAGAVTVSRQVGCQHIPAVMGEPAALQDPDAVCVEHAVQHHHGGLCGVEGFAAGVAIGAVAVDGQFHGVRLFNLIFRRPEARA